jgi:transposase
MPPFLKSVGRSTQKKRKVGNATGTSAKMNTANKAICCAMRKTGAKLKDIRKLVKKTDGKRPSLAAISMAAASFHTEKKKRGATTGSSKITKADEKKIMQKFHKLRPPGHGVDSRAILKALPKKLREQISRRFIIRFLASKGYKPERKLNKTDPGVRLKLKRCNFGKRHAAKSPQQWKSHLQAVGDFKEFTWYPTELQPTFQKLRASWTYMRKSEKKLPAFVRPKRWFAKKEYKKVKKHKVFGLTTSSGKSLAFSCPSPWNSVLWAALVDQKVNPFLKRAFPGKKKFHLLLDSEPLLHTDEAKASYTRAGITTEAWPKYSPDLNPQEQVWAWAEPKLRRLETGTDAFEPWKKKVLKAVQAYPAKGKLIPSMARRCQTLVKRSGAMLDD